MHMQTRCSTSSQHPAYDNCSHNLVVHVMEIGQVRSVSREEELTGMHAALVHSSSLQSASARPLPAAATGSSSLSSRLSAGRAGLPPLRALPLPLPRAAVFSSGLFAAAAAFFAALGAAASSSLPLSASGSSSSLLAASLSLSLMVAFLAAFLGCCRCLAGAAFLALAGRPPLEPAGWVEAARRAG